VAALVSLFLSNKPPFVVSVVVAEVVTVAFVVGVCFVVVAGSFVTV
jgi:hypothetical protein